MKMETLAEALKKSSNYEAFVLSLCRAANDAYPEDFVTVLNLAKSNKDYVEHTKFPAIAALPAWGKHGVKALKELVLEDTWTSRPSLSVLLSLATGRVPLRADMPFMPKNWDTLCKYMIKEESINEARKAIQEIVMSMFDDSMLQSTIFSAIGDMQFHSIGPMREKLDASEISDEEYAEFLKKGDSNYVEKIDFFFRSIIDPRLTLNLRIIEQFSELLDASPEKEKELHEFLFAHPVLLDPLAIEIRS